MKKAKHIVYNPDGSLTLDPFADAANADWIRAARLKSKADAGDKEAAAELKRLEETPLYYDDGE